MIQGSARSRGVRGTPLLLIAICCAAALAVGASAAARGQKTTAATPLDGLVLSLRGQETTRPGGTISACPESRAANWLDEFTAETVRKSSGGWSRAGLGGTGFVGTPGNAFAQYRGDDLVSVGGSAVLEGPGGGPRYVKIGFGATSQECNALPAVGASSAGTVYEVKWLASSACARRAGCDGGSPLGESGTGCIALNRGNGEQSVVLQLSQCSLSAMVAPPKGIASVPTSAVRLAIAKAIRANRSTCPSACSVRSADTRVSKTNPNYAYARFSDAKLSFVSVILRQMGGTWRVVLFGSDRAGCGRVAKSILRDLRASC